MSARETLSFCCVYRSGGDFSGDYVRQLAAGLVHHHPDHEVRLICLTDLGEEVSRSCGPLDGSIVFNLRLQTRWPGWWSKMEMFTIPGPMVYLDLDTVVVGDLSPLFRHLAQESPPHDLLMLRDFNNGRGQSGVMAWNGDQKHLTEAFTSDAEIAHWHVSTSRVGATMGDRNYRGDGDWLATHLNRQPHNTWPSIDEALPGVLSFKKHIRHAPGQRLPSDARLICFHGKPRPTEVSGVRWLEDAMSRGRQEAAR